MQGILPHRALSVAGLLLLAPSCVTVKPVVLDRKTQLENQILGTFQRLEDDLILASSVRGERQEPRLSGLEREAVDAMMSREFHRDDLEALKGKQLVGEANTGRVVLLAGGAGGPGGRRRQSLGAGTGSEAGVETTGEAAEAKVEAQRAQQLVEEENRCRLVLLRRVIALDPSLSEKDLPELWQVLYRLNLQTARPGERIQGKDGAWRAATAPEKR